MSFIYLPVETIDLSTGHGIISQIDHLSIQSIMDHSLETQ